MAATTFSSFSSSSPSSFWRRGLSSFRGKKDVAVATTGAAGTTGAAAGGGGAGSTTPAFRKFLFLLVFQVILLSILSLTFQLIAVNQIDSSFFPGDFSISSSSSSSSSSLDPLESSTQDKSATETAEVVAYVITVTGCGQDRNYNPAAAQGLITQGAAVLHHSIELAHRSSSYDYQMYAIIHPTATQCSQHVLDQLGYTTLVRNTPFDRKDIRGEFLREHIDRASCCGEKEFIKLYAYTLMDHPVAVVLDLDSLVLQPLDPLFDVIVKGSNRHNNNINSNKKLPLHEGDNVTLLLPPRVDAFYTRDYNMINSGLEKYAGVQGGFLMVRPSEETFHEYIDIVLEGNYISGKGWGGKYGYFFGGMQIQGICAYYWEELHPETSIELNRCIINSMVDNPYFKSDDKKKPNGCRDGRKVCDDCRYTPLSDIRSAHLTICGKPWNCMMHWGDDDLDNNNGGEQGLCSLLHREWFRIRKDFEMNRKDNELRVIPELNGTQRPDIHFGYCKRGGQNNYLPIKV